MGFASYLSIGLNSSLFFLPENNNYIKEKTGLSTNCSVAYSVICPLLTASYNSWEVEKGQMYEY